MNKQDLHAQVEETLTNHPPVHPDMGLTLDLLSQMLRDVGHELVDHCPVSRELSIALTKLQEVRMFAVAAVALNQDKL